MIFSTVAVALLAATSAVQAFPRPGGNTPAPSVPAAVDFSRFAPTDPLANHGFLPRVGMTEEGIKKTLQTVLLMDDFSSNLFATQGIALGYNGTDGTKRVDLGLFNKHNVIEHDASLTRSDLFFGDAVSFNETLYTQMKSFSTDGKYLTPDQLAKFRAVREKDSKARNPEYTFGPQRQFTAYGEAALLVIAMSDDTGNIRLDWTDVLFRQERFPVELGWKPRSISTPRVLAVAADLRVKAALA
ncbi:hypothetical protein HDU96_010848 [Phlyctochytrium bullatum]|nr:hypothetical protein HDU96_010848 [Phlyctochytrium bullatum]